MHQGENGDIDSLRWAVGFLSFSMREKLVFTSASWRKIPQVSLPMYLRERNSPCYFLPVFMEKFPILGYSFTSASRREIPYR
jgi:hypothetical protein